MALNSSLKQPTGYTPHRLLYGIDLRACSRKGRKRQPSQLLRVKEEVPHHHLQNGISGIVHSGQITLISSLRIPISRVILMSLMLGILRIPNLRRNISDEGLFHLAPSDKPIVPRQQCSSFFDRKSYHSSGEAFGPGGRIPVNSARREAR